MKTLTRRGLLRTAGRSAIALAACIALQSAARAKTVAWVSFHTDPNAASAGAAAAVPPHTVAPDKGYTDLLTTAGYTVTRVLTVEGAPSQATIDTLNASDLVIIGRSQNSAFFDSAAEFSVWNTLAKPMIVMSGFVSRDNRLGLNSGDTTADATNADVDQSGAADGHDFLVWQRFLSQTTATPAQADIDGSATVNAADLTRWIAAFGGDGRSMKLNVPAAAQSHPIFAGITFDGAGNTVNPFASSVAFSGVLQRSISINSTAINPGGTLLATVVSPGVAATAPMIYEYPAGASSSTSAVDVFGGKRLVFYSGSREVQGISTETAGLLDLTADGKTMFINAVKYMAGPPASAVPEPATGVLAIAAAVGLLASRRRR